MTVHMGERCWTEEPTAILCICNGRHYGGGFMPVADAMPDDGVLDMLRVGKVGLPTFLRLVRKYARGLYWQFPEYVDAYQGQEVSFSARKPITVVVDGEVVGRRALAQDGSTIQMGGLVFRLRLEEGNAL